MKNRKRYKAILFSTDMVNSIMNDTKTQTRRIDEHNSKYKNYFVGDVLWVRETFEYYSATWDNHGFDNNEPTVVFNYKATDGYNVEEVSVSSKFAFKALLAIEDSKKKQSTWKPSIFMPREACRNFLHINSIKQEQLHDISEEDARAEGVQFLKMKGFENPSAYRNYMDNSSNPFTMKTAKESFKSLWIKINGLESWNANPTVIVFTFKRINKPADFC